MMPSAYVMIPAMRWIVGGKAAQAAIKWTRLSCRTFAANAVRLQLHVLAYNFGNFLRTLATPEPIKDWSLTSLASDNVRRKIADLRELGFADPIKMITSFPPILGLGIDNIRGKIAVREEISKRYRFIAYTQRYHGVGPWKDDGKHYSTATHVDDLAKFITSLNAGPVHLVGRSGGGAIGTTAALKHPPIVRSLILPAESPEGKVAREDRAKSMGPVIAAINANDAIRATRLAYEYVSQLPPGGLTCRLVAFVPKNGLRSNAPNQPENRRPGRTG